MTNEKSDSSGASVTTATPRNWVAIFAACVSVISAAIAAFQAHTAVTVPFRSVLYGQRSTALSNFILASGNLNAALAKVRVDIPWDVEMPGSVALDTDGQLKANARAAAAIIPAHGTYLAGVNASLPLWTNETRAKIGASISASKMAADCYVQLGSHTGEMSPDYWAKVRALAGPSCENARAAVATFSQSVATAEAAMIEELRRTESEDVPPGNGNQASGF
jgi:hypothetical protein